MRTNIDIGIYIGNEYSSIARMENGEPTVLTSDVLKETMPTCVAFNKKKHVLVGDNAVRIYRTENYRSLTEKTDINSFIEFLKTVGTKKKYYSSNINKELSSEELIAEIIKALKSFIPDEEVETAVITIPAKFTINQKDAVRRAGELAGLKQVELLEEPVAASMAYDLDVKSKDGYWLVFDFGGGTFNAALLKVEDGIMKVIDTEGDNYLGGKNLDYAIVEEIMIPHIQENHSITEILNGDKSSQKFKDALKFWAEDIKNQLSFKEDFNLYVDPGDDGNDDDGEEIEIDLTVNQEMLKSTLEPIFQKAINISLSLLKRKNIEGNTLNSLILVGGPTYSPILRKMLEEQIIKPDVSVDPMTVVSKGAALYASTIDSETVEIETGRIQLELGHEATTVETEELITVKLLKDKTKGILPDKLFVDIVRSDKAWSSGKQEVKVNGDIIEVKLNEDKSNLFNVIAYNANGDIIPCQPDNFSILQGTFGMKATLPYNIGIEVKSKASGKIVFRSIKGLEKNQSTPATGTTNGLKTERDVYPGSKDIVLKLPIYQGEYGADGTRAIYNEHIYDIVITGEDLPKFLPKGSSVDITIRVDKSGRVTLSAFFPLLDFTYDFEPDRDFVQGEIDASWLESEINKAQQTLTLIKQGGVYSDNEKLEKLGNEISGTKKLLENGKGDTSEKSGCLNDLRKSLIELEKIEAEIEWPKTEEELKDVFYRLEETNQKFGNEKTNAIVEQFKEQIPEIIKEKNIKVAQEMIDNIRQLENSLIKYNPSIEKKNILLEIDILKTKLIDNLEENENLTTAVFSKLFDELFELGKEIEGLTALDEYHLSRFEDINKQVKEILG